MDGWEKRNKVDDITAEKRSDAIMSNERLYDQNRKSMSSRADFTKNTILTVGSMK
jgi:hypothetical protein